MVLTSLASRYAAFKERNMNVFVSGATGFIGASLVRRLASQGHIVHALYRSEEKAKLILTENVRLFKGDILDKLSVLEAMKGCTQGYHIAAFAGVWAKDPGLIRRLNVEATLSIIDAAGRQGMERLVVTSTAGILGPSSTTAVNEQTPVPESFFTQYESSKWEMEQEIARLRIMQPEIVIVNPTRVYGPGLLSESNGVTRMIGRYIEGKWKLIPGNGLKSGNYVYIEDVVAGHLLAMEKGRSGERYVLGGENISYRRLFELTREISGVIYRLFRIPLWIMLSAAWLMKMMALISGNPPLIVPGLVRKFNHHWIVSSEKAREQLGYEPLDAREGLARTIRWIREYNN